MYRAINLSDSLVEFKICPKCFSHRVVLHLGGMCGQLYKCLDCNYIGSIVLIVDEENYMKLIELKRERSIKQR